MKNICDYCNKETEVGLFIPRCGLLGQEIGSSDLHDKICKDCEEDYFVKRNSTLNYRPPFKKEHRKPILDR